MLLEAPPPAEFMGAPVFHASRTSDYVNGHVLAIEPTPTVASHGP
jgi:hypothetical protein